LVGDEESMYLFGRLVTGVWWFGLWPVANDVDENTPSGPNVVSVFPLRMIKK